MAKPTKNSFEKFLKEKFFNNILSPTLEKKTSKNLISFFIGNFFFKLYIEAIKNLILQNYFVVIQKKFLQISLEYLTFNQKFFLIANQKTILKQFFL